MKNPWVRILIAGVVAELVLLLIVLLNFAPWGPMVVQIIVIPACLGVVFAAGWWAARRMTRRHVLNGFLVGVLTVVIYYALTWGQTLPLTFHIAGLAKLVGGAAGGWYAARRRA